MANIMQQVKLKNHTSRNSFDLSHRNAFTAKIGELLPVACMEVIPGDYYSLSHQHFTRTIPVNTAAFTRVREYYDWFFVPTNLLWNKFNTFVSQMVDNNQHSVSINERVVLGDTHPYFTTSQINSYLTKMSNSISITNVRNSLGFKRSNATAKLLNYLDYGDFSASIRVGSDANQNAATYRESVAYNPFPLLAYQKIYQDYFRNSQWEKAFAPAFNIDYITGNGSMQIPVIDMEVDNGSENMFDLRYANWHKDLFMGVLPNAQYDSAASIYLSDDGLGFSLDVFSLNGTPSGSFNVGVKTGRIHDGHNIYTTEDSSGNRLFTEIGSSPLKSNFSILALRQAEALQKWKEITQSQQQDYRSQVEAHFGVSPDRGLSEMSRWIDGSVSTLDISEVMNTNITSDNAADIAGKGVGVGQGKSTFQSDVHGYLMCIYHAVPLLDYSVSGTSRMNLKTKVTDYAIPEFDRTGMVSIPFIELTNRNFGTSVPVDLMGYAPRYYDYKTKVDNVHGAFRNSLSHWVAPFSDSYLYNYFQDRTRLSIDYSFFKISPSTMNPIFAVDADDTVDSDQLLIQTHFDISAVRNLDRNGLPY